MGKLVECQKGCPFRVEGQNGKRCWVVCRARTNIGERVNAEVFMGGQKKRIPYAGEGVPICHQEESAVQRRRWGVKRQEQEG